MFSQFSYDYSSRRAFTREYDFANGGWANPVFKRRVFDGLDVVQERDNANQVTAQLVRDGGVGGILSRTTADGAAFYGYDGNGNGNGNVTLLTNAAGQDVGHYRYDAFGNTLEAEGPRAAENPYRFSTKEWHGPSGLYDYGFRFYSPGMGRWMNRDPLQEEGGINLYAMVGNNPVNDVDAYGLAPAKDDRPCMHDGIPNSCGPGGGGPKNPTTTTPKSDVPTPSPAPVPIPTPPPKSKAPQPLATVTKSSGAVTITNRQNSPRKGVVGTKLYAGDVIKTGRRSGVDIKLSDGSSVRAGQLSIIEVRGPRKPESDNTFLDKIKTFFGIDRYVGTSYTGEIKG